MQRGIGASGVIGFAVLVLAIGWGTGRLDQRLFDDEILTLAAIETRSYGELIAYYLGGQDVHPPLSFLWFRLLQDLQAPIGLQRGLSLAVAALGFAAVLDLVWRRLPDGATASRALAIALFLGAPLLYGMGAALRWYPLLVLPVALAFCSALNRGRPTMVAAVAMAVAANISFLAAIPATAYLSWRYLVMRRFDAAWDVPFLLGMISLSAPALTAFGFSAFNVPGQLDTNTIQSTGLVALGVFGGYGLGLTPSVIVVPFALLALLALFGALQGFRRPSIGDVLGLSLLILILCAFLTVAGFGKPRSYLFAVPFLLTTIVLGGFSLPWHRSHALVTLACALVVTAASLWLLNGNDRPFKRNLHVSDAAVLAAVRQQAPAVGDAIILSSEPGLAWQLRREGYCVLAPSLAGGCTRQTAQVIIVIDDGTDTARTGFESATSGMTREHRLVHQQLFGSDEDAPTKQFLSSRRVPKWLVSVAVYRRE